MRLLPRLLLCLGVLASQCAARDELESRNALPANFKPPPVFRNANLVRTINLDKGYVRESINVVIENISSAPQTHYYVPFDAQTIGKVGGFEVRDKQDSKKPAFPAEVVEYDVTRCADYMLVWSGSDRL